MKQLVYMLIATTMVGAGIATNRPASAASAMEQEAYDIGFEAYLYLYPLVLMDVTRRQATNIEAGKLPGRGPMNTFVHIPTFPPADFRDVVRPNFDTLYSFSYLDLTNEPIIVSAPDTGGRYYMLQMLDMWTDVFANPGKRSTGTKASHFALVPPGWFGKIPDDVKRIDSPTGMVWIIGRTQTNGPADYKAVNKIQAGYKLTKLSEWGKKSYRVTARIDPDVDMKTPPMIQVNKMAPGAFFAYAAELMKINPPHPTDHDMVARLTRIGIEPGKGFDFGKASPTVEKALEKAAGDALETMQEKATTIFPIINHWSVATDGMGVYGNSYLRRAIVAMIGLGANPPEDAVYPLTFTDGQGKPLDAANEYVLRLKKDEIPPVDAFWSLTLYDKDGFPVPNEIERQALGDRDKMKFGGDGSLEIFIQANSPGKDKEANWLPAPKSGPFNLVLRLYAPRREVLDGTWAPPAVRKVK
ncbi:MAG: DUF1254 domain-containing protein [Proteobacteria bacterium]|nr:DUF1254 domain-containing protein [Pseudomonadota bacterium]